MGSALLNTAADAEHAAKVSRPVDELRVQVAERLAAHRSRRGAARVQATTEPVRDAAGGRSAQIAAAVAERYARTPSYREVLAAEAERAIQQARAAAEVAALNAQAIAAAQQRLLEAYDEHARREQALWPDLVPDKPATRTETAVATKTARRAEGRTATNGSTKPGSSKAGSNIPDALGQRATTTTAAVSPGAGLTVRLYAEDAVQGGRLSARTAAIPAMHTRLREDRSYCNERNSYSDDHSVAEATALDEEIAFRQAPVFEEPAGPPVALPANLIEFPRQLVASRKARPRYAEGPLRDEMDAAPGDGQLRIFEVDPAQISTSPVEAEAQTAQWSSLWLDAPARAASAAGEAEADALLEEPLAQTAAVLQPASLARRCAAGAINAAIVLSGLLAFAVVLLVMTDHGIPRGAAMQQMGALLARTGLQPRSIATISVVSGTLFLLMYHALFFWFSSATPGMRCVRIALCTFEDENPTRAGVRRRMAAAMLSSCSLGMGYAWAALDEQRLTWHDRISRMYLRRY